MLLPDGCQSASELWIILCGSLRALGYGEGAVGRVSRHSILPRILQLVMEVLKFKHFSPSLKYLNMLVVVQKQINHD